MMLTAPTATPKAKSAAQAGSNDEAKARQASEQAISTVINVVTRSSRLNAFKREDRVTTLMTVLMACSLACLAFASSLLPACAALFAFGVAVGAVSIIVQARIQ